MQGMIPRGWHLICSIVGSRKMFLSRVPSSRTKPNVLKIWYPQTGMEESVTTMAAIEPSLPPVAATYDWQVGGKRSASNPINSIGKKAFSIRKPIFHQKTSVENGGDECWCVPGLP
jgi:hypothetical protein